MGAAINHLVSYVETLVATSADSVPSSYLVHITYNFEETSDIYIGSSLSIYIINPLFPLVATLADSLPSSYLVRITIAPIGSTFGNLQ